MWGKRIPCDLDAPCLSAKVQDLSKNAPIGLLKLAGVQKAVPNLTISQLRNQAVKSWRCTEALLKK
jgi:hypothetical protein